MGHRFSSHSSRMVLASKCVWRNEDAVLVAVALFPGLGEVHPYLCAARVFGTDSWQLIPRFTLAHPISWNQTWPSQGTALDGNGRLGHHGE